jgi:hypothetical protein
MRSRSKGAQQQADRRDAIDERMMHFDIDSAAATFDPFDECRLPQGMSPFQMLRVQAFDQGVKLTAAPRFRECEVLKVGLDLDLLVLNPPEPYAPSAQLQGTDTVGTPPILLGFYRTSEKAPLDPLRKREEGETTDMTGLHA